MSASGKTVEEAHGSWTSRVRQSVLAQIDWSTFGSVLLILILAGYLRFYFDFSSTIYAGFPSLSGGSDADFYYNVLNYALHTGHQLLYDPMLDYPIGSYNPFLPFYVWLTVLLAWPISFLFHMPLIISVHAGVVSGGLVAFSAISAISGLIATIVAYYLGKELFSKEAGIIAAAFVAFLPSLLSESTAGFGVHDPFVLMLTALFFFFTFRSLNNIQGHRWVEHWNRKGSFSPDFASIYSGLITYFSENRRSLTYAFMAGIVLGSIADAWEGFSYIVVIFSLFYLIESFIYKFKNRDTFALTSIYFVVNLTTLLVSFDVYYTTHSIYPWYYVSILFFIGTMVAGIIYTVARDVPWLTLLISLVAAVLVILGVFELVDRKFLHSIVSRVLLAQSYFIKSPVYTTIAEALAPPFSLLVLSLGGAVFFIAFAYLLYALYRPRKLDASHTLLLIWFLIAAFMAVTTVRFVLDATTVFALYSAEGIVLLLRWVDFGEARKGFQNYGVSWSGVRKSVKIKHVLAVLFVAFVISMPLSWMAIDAATPTNVKSNLNSQVYSLLPSILRPPGYVNNASNLFYFGGFGYSLESPNTYFPAAWAYLDNLTANTIPFSARPAYLSWWDYGSEVVTFAQVPAVADDFQQGYHLASAFLFSENETQAISLLSARLIYGSFVTNGSTLTPQMQALLSSYGINVSYVYSVLKDPGSFKQLVLSNPSVYGPFSSSVTAPSVMYAVLMVVLSNMSTASAVNLYQQVSKLTGKFIGFFSVDSRLIPFSATDTGVFYAPAYLGGRPIIGPGVYDVPYNYYTIQATTTTGLSYPIQDVPAGSQVSSYSIQYQPLFYNMTMYRMFFGYSGYGITGQNISGLPGLSGSFTSDPQLSRFQPLPGWMMSNFEMIYRTAYYNPWPLKYVAAHPNAWQAIDYSTALKLEKADPTFSNYTVDLSPTSDFENGIVLMEYFPGAYVNGTVLLANGQPAAGIRVTVLDQYGIPHYVTYTNSQGRYSAIALEGNDTIVFSTGALNSVAENLTQVGNALKEMTVNVSYAAAMREPVINQSTGLPVYNIEMPVVTLSPTGLTGHVFFKYAGNYTYNPSYSIPVRNVMVRAVNASANLSYEAYAPDGFYNISSMMPGTYDIYVDSGSTSILAASNVTVSYNSSAVSNLGISQYFINGTVDTPSGPASGIEVTIRGVNSNVTVTTVTSTQGTFSASQLLAGNYTVSVNTASYTVQPQTVPAVIYNATNPYTSLDIRVLPKGHLSGMAYLGSSPVIGAHIFFYGDVPGEGNFYTVTQNGYYSLSLPKGVYTYYSIYYENSIQYVALGNVTVSSSTSMNIAYTKGYTISGKVYSSAGSYAEALLFFENGATQLQASSTSEGDYSAVLPAGTYSVWTFGGGAYLGSVSVSSSLTYDIHESASSTYTGASYTELTGTVSNISALVTLNYNGRQYSFYTGVNGSYAVQLPKGSFNATVSAPGYVSANYVFSSKLRMLLLLEPQPVSVHINYSSSIPIPSGAYFYLQAINSSEQQRLTMSGDVLTAEIIPGVHSFNVSGYPNSMVLSVSSSRFVVSPGIPFQANVSVSVKYNLTLYFSYPSGYSNSTPVTRVDIFSHALSQPLALNSFRNGGSIYLPPSNITLYAYSSLNGTAFVFLTSFVLQGAMSYSMKLTPSLELSGITEYNGTPLASARVNIVRVPSGAEVQAAVQSNGTFSVSLPAGNYTVNSTYSATINYNGRERVVGYYAQTSVDLQSSVHVTLVAHIVPLNYTVSGTAEMFYGIPAPATLHFIAESGTAMNATVATSSDGSYSISLAPGLYTVETYGNNVSNVTTLNVRAATVFNPSLQFAYSVQGNVQAAGIGAVNATIGFSGPQGSFNISASGGRYSLLLPSGVYRVTASYVQTVDGTLYRYGFNGTYQITGSSVIPLMLQLVPTYGVTLSVVSNSTGPLASGFVQVRLLVRNTGDVPDIVYLATSTSGWFAAFDPAYVILGTGNASSAYVNATLSSFKVAGGLSTVRLIAYSPLDPSLNSSTSVQVRVPEQFGFSASFSSFGNESAGRKITFTLVVSNTGNTKANFVAYMSDLQAMRAEGWNGGIYTTSAGPFYNETLFTLNPGQNQTLTVSLTVYGMNATNMVPATVTVMERETGASYTVSVPLSLPAPVAKLSGVAVNGNGASPSPPPLITFRMGLVIFLLAAFVIGDVYMAKRKRLI